MSYRIAKKGIPHTIGENLCLPVAKHMVNCVLGEKTAKTLDKIPLSDNTVAHCIDSISTDILSQLISRIKNCEFFSLQVDESTYIANLSNLLVYVCIYLRTQFMKMCCFAVPLSHIQQGKIFFYFMDSFFRAHVIDWMRCVGVCTDGETQRPIHPQGPSNKKHAR